MVQILLILSKNRHLSLWKAISEYRPDVSTTIPPRDGESVAQERAPPMPRTPHAKAVIGFTCDFTAEHSDMKSSLKDFPRKISETFHLYVLIWLDLLNF